MFETADSRSTPELSATVQQLLHQQRRSSREVAEQLGLTPQEVMRLATAATAQQPGEQFCPEARPAQSNQPMGNKLEQLKQQVIDGLLVRTRPGMVDAFPASALVRLWQLLEDHLQQTASAESEETLPDLPEPVWEQLCLAWDNALETLASEEPEPGGGAQP